LSVSILAITSPDLICSPSFLHHSAIVPAAIVCEEEARAVC